MLTEVPRFMDEYATDLNGDLDPAKISTGSSVRLWWRCDMGHEWQASPNGRRDSGCDRCAAAALAVRRHAAERKTVADIPALVTRWAEPDIDPSTVPLASRKKFRWRCAAGHEVVRRASASELTHTCAQCSGRAASPENNLAVVDEALASEWHPTLNDRGPETVVPKSYYKAWWIGECGHEWEREVYVRARGQGCPFCRGMSTATENSLAVTRPELANDWAVERNGSVTAYDVSSGSNRVVWWRCSTGHEWKTTVASRAISGTGCPRCHRLRQRSVREIRLAAELAHIFDSNLAVCEVATADGPWSVDFASDHAKLVVEYDGSRYHTKEGYRERDERKTRALIDAGWTVVRVRELPLELINEWDVSAAHSGNIRPVVDAVLASVTLLRPELAALPALRAYVSGHGTVAHGVADRAVATLRKAQRPA